MKAGFLLDVNVLIAMAWPTHRDHKKVLEWLAHHAREGWATCPLTQTSFERIRLEPGFFLSASVRVSQQVTYAYLIEG